MAEMKKNMPKKHICIGLLAHVDAGKTTLSEAILYTSGTIRQLGRVDNKDAFLDTFSMERERGITIFSKQAVFPLSEDTEVTLLDTPGHVDFSAEMERTLQVLDYAILVISGADGVQGHTQTLWRLLKQYNVPAFLFVNKMDQEGTDKTSLMQELQTKLDAACVDFTDQGAEAFLENVAVCDDDLMEQYLETGEIKKDKMIRLIRQRKLFPCFFGSALKLEGVDKLLKGILEYTISPSYGEAFAARVFKIARDDQGNRLTYLKVTGGRLRVKDLLGESEKVNEIRIYSGSKYETVQEVQAGMVCAVTGLAGTFPGEALGEEMEAQMPVLEPVLTYRVILQEDVDVHTMLKQLRELEEEEPLLHVTWEESLQEIHAQMMGEVQIEILKQLIKERFGVRVEFGAGEILYKETIEEVSEGVGHFEPLRHYAEVHLLLEPGEQGSGLQFASVCSEDVLDRNWQRLILTHLEEKEHKGVLTGSPITDMKLTLVSGKAHLKHTEGGDFRQATYRAVRQGLKKANSILLEPYYSYQLEVPSESVGRAMSDIQRMSGTFDVPQQEGDQSILKGTAPVSEMRDYQTEVISYTRGRGRLSCALEGYQPCHNTEEVLERIGYDSERDLENPTGSVFCAHGAGFVVKWDEVEQHMHLPSVLQREAAAEPEEELPAGPIRRAASVLALSAEEERELEEMVQASMRKRETARKKYVYSKAQKIEAGNGEASSYRKKDAKKSYLLVDGYNIIFAWDELRELAEENMEAARGRLIDILSDFHGMREGTLIVVFDAYKLEGYPGEVQKYQNIYIVYTKEAETADQYIEKVAHEMGRKHDVTVATSDGTEQVIIRGQGCRLLSAKELEEEVLLAREQIREAYLQEKSTRKNYLFQYMDEETAKEMEKVRLGKNEDDGIK